MDLDSTCPDDTLPSDAGFNPRTASVEALVSRFPHVGVLAAEDIVAYRDQYGTFPDLETLTTVLGVEAEVAACLLSSSDLPARSTLGPGFTAQPSEAAAIALLAKAPAKDAFAPVAKTEPVPSGEEAAAEPGGDAEAAEPGIAVANELARCEPPARAQVMPPSLPAPVVIEMAPEVPVFSEPPTQVVLASLVPRLPRKRSRIPLVVGALALVNALLGAGMFYLHREHKRAAAPVAALATDLDALKHQQAETHAKVDEVRGRVTKQESALARNVAKVDETDKRLALDEAEAKERDARTAKELAGLGARVKHVERGVVDGAYALSLKEAVKVIDAVRPPPQRLAPRDGSRGPVSMR